MTHGPTLPGTLAAILTTLCVVLGAAVAVGQIVGAAVVIWRGIRI